MQNYKKSTALHFASIHMFSEIAQVYLGLANYCKVRKRHLTEGYKLKQHLAGIIIFWYTAWLKREEFK